MMLISTCISWVIARRSASVFALKLLKRRSSNRRSTILRWGETIDKEDGPINLEPLFTAKIDPLCVWSRLRQCRALAWPVIFLSQSFRGECKEKCG